MLTSIFTKSLRDRWIGEVVGAVSIALLLVFTMAIYVDIDTSFYYDLPAAVLDAVGINPDLGGLSGIAYGSIYNLMGALTFGGLAISIGASSIAGEERDGTLELLLGNPRSRGRVLGSKVAALAVLTVLGGAILWLAGIVAPQLLAVDVNNVDQVALVVHLAANALLWGMVAVAIGGWTGNRTAASGVTAGLMVLAYLLATLLPLFEGAEGLADWSPWYWFSGHQPEANGIDVGHLARQLGSGAVMGVVAVVGLDRRDLRERRGRTTLVDRMRQHPMTQKFADRVAGSARVSSIVTKSSADHQGLLIVVAYILFVLGLVYGPMYNLLPDTFTDVLSEFPDALLSMVGQADMSTAAGWLQAETFSLVVPIAMITVLVTVGARALAGEEEQSTMGLLLANPVPRRRVVLAKAGVMAIYGVVLGVATFAGVSLGVVVGGLDVAITALAATTTLGVLLGLVFGAVAVSAATGRVRWALVAPTGVALLAWVAWSFLPLSESAASWANLSPFDWYLGSDPLNNGMAWGDAALLAAVAVVVVAGSIPLFDRRDLRG